MSTDPSSVRARVHAGTWFPVLLLLGALSSACSDGESATADAGATKPAAAAPAQKEKTAGAKKPKPASAPQAQPGTTDSAAMAYQAGLQELAKGQPKRAEEQFARAIELDPSMSEAHFELGKLRIHLSSQNVGSTARDLDVLEQGLASLEKALELEPSNDQYAYWLGRGYHLAKERDKAGAALKKAVELNPENAEAWKRLGMVYVDDADLEQARAAFEKAIELDPKEPGSMFQLGQTLELLQDTEGARKAYQRSIEVDPTMPQPYGALAKLLAKAGDDAGAAEAQKKHEEWQEFDTKLKRRMTLVNQNPSDAAALRRLGEMYVSVEKWSEAADWCLKAIQIDPKDAQAHLYCGMARRHLKEFENAKNHLKEAEYLAPDVLDPKLELLHLYSETEDTGQFDELLARVETEAAEDGASLQTLGELCKEVGRAEDAQRLLDKAKALGTTAEPAPAGGG